MSTNSQELGHIKGYKFIMSRRMRRRGGSQPALPLIEDLGELGCSSLIFVGFAPPSDLKDRASKILASSQDPVTDFAKLPQWREKLRTAPNHAVALVPAPGQPGKFIIKDSGRKQAFPYSPRELARSIIHVSAMYFFDIVL